MSRLTYIARKPGRTLPALAALLAAVGVVAGSGANFTATAANPGNTFASGTLSVENSADGAAILTASGLKPGGTAQTGTVDIANTGDLPGTFTLARTNLTESDATNPLSGKLNLVVTDCGTFAGATPPTCGDGDDASKYSGTLAAMSSAIALGTYAAADKHRYRFSMGLDGSAGNEYQGDNSGARFQWDAAQ
jgi:hypothetical protein